MTTEFSENGKSNNSFISSEYLKNNHQENESFEHVNHVPNSTNTRTLELESKILSEISCISKKHNNNNLLYDKKKVSERSRQFQSEVDSPVECCYDDNHIPHSSLTKFADSELTDEHNDNNHIVQKTDQKSYHNSSIRTCNPKSETDKALISKCNKSDESITKIKDFHKNSCENHLLSSTENNSNYQSNQISKDISAIYCTEVNHSVDSEYKHKRDVNSFVDPISLIETKQSPFSSIQNCAPMMDLSDRVDNNKLSTNSKISSAHSDILESNRSTNSMTKTNQLSSGEDEPDKWQIQTRNGQGHASILSDVLFSLRWKLMCQMLLALPVVGVFICLFTALVWHADHINDTVCNVSLIYV